MDKQNDPFSTLEAELNWFNLVLETRIEQYFQQKPDVIDPLTISPPDLKEDDSIYAGMVNHYELTPPERLVLMLALAPDLKPEMLDIFFTYNKTFDRGFTEFGGVLGKMHGGFVPTVETAIFLLSGGDLTLRMYFMPMFEEQHIFLRLKILDLEYKEKMEPFGGVPLRLSRDTLDMLLLGYLRNPETGSEFPAKLLSTNMEWEDLVLVPKTREQLIEIQAWLDHGHTLLHDWKLGKNIKPGYRSLFFGPPGTGKTLTATLLGKQAERNVYRIDLSRLVSKYIGETEKNLELIFRRAEQKDWILFFDEADSLFGNRTQVSSSNDRFANQETAYLLQRLEDCPNVVILASNLKGNIDEAFTRRFQSTVYFPMPQKKERQKLWQKGFSPISTLERIVSLDKLSEDYELAGGSIINVIRYCSLMAIKRDSQEISNTDLVTGIQRELNKEGRTA